MLFVQFFSIFPEIRKKNRSKFKKYFEVYIKSELKDLISRDNKGLYKKFLQKKNKKCCRDGYKVSSTKKF